MKSEEWNEADPWKRLTTLATLAGWTNVYTYEDNSGPDLLCGTPPEWQLKLRKGSGDYHHSSREIPDFLNDLNRMREIETIVLPEDKITRYIVSLLEIVCRDAHQKPPAWISNADIAFMVASAKAQQRAEAFVVTMEKNEN